MSVAYTSTKHAVTGLTKCISLDGRKNDITASQIDIGNALTELAARMANGVPQADGSIKPEPLMDVKHVGDAVLHMANLPLDVNVQFMTIMATKMPFVGRGILTVGRGKASPTKRPAVASLAEDRAQLLGRHDLVYPAERALLAHGDGGVAHRREG